MTRRITPAGLLGSVALSASVQLARTGAGKLSDAVDTRLQKEFDSIYHSFGKWHFVPKAYILRDLSLESLNFEDIKIRCI